MNSTTSAYRKSFVYVLAGICCLVMFVAWACSLTGMFDGGLMRSQGFSTFIILFVVPVGVSMSFLATQRKPVMLVEKDTLELRSGIFPWRVVTLQREDIESVETDYHPDTTKCDLVISLADNAPSALRAPTVWRKTDRRGCYFNLSNTTITPPQAEAAISEWLGRSGK